MSRQLAAHALGQTRRRVRFAAVRTIALASPEGLVGLQMLLRQLLQTGAVLEAQLALSPSLSRLASYASSRSIKRSQLRVLVAKPVLERLVAQRVFQKAAL